MARVGARRDDGCLRPGASYITRITRAGISSEPSRIYTKGARIQCALDKLLSSRRASPYC